MGSRRETAANCLRMALTICGLVVVIEVSIAAMIGVVALVLF